ncbi:Transcriptional regulator, partial [hydrothermal vent metagenome]
ENYNFPGNIRQLRNIAEQISVVEEKREITAEKLLQYLPSKGSNLPSVIEHKNSNDNFANERDIMYKILFDMRNDINDLKKLTLDLMESGDTNKVQEDNKNLIKKIYKEENTFSQQEENQVEVVRINERYDNDKDNNYEFAETIDADESLSIQEKEIELIKKSLDRNNGKRKLAAKELGISERTLYRKIKQYNL